MFMNKILDKLVGKFFLMLQKVFNYKWTNTDYGIKEAIIFPRNIDTFNRYSILLHHLIKNNNLNKKNTLLEIGAGGLGILNFLRKSNYDEYFDVTLFDLDEKRMLVANGENVVIGDSNNLPFKDNSFDFVISLDCEGLFEEQSIHEMKRAAKIGVIIHFPIDSDDGVYLGTRMDAEFQKQHVRFFNTPDEWTASALKNNYPRLDKIKKILPGANICGTENGYIWVRHMINARRQILGYFSGLYYLFLLKRKNFVKPYRGAIISYNKTKQ